MHFDIYIILNQNDLSTCHMISITVNTNNNGL